MNRINQLFIAKKENILNIYFTAGFPAIDSTLQIARALENSGADMIEIGIPYSDPVADGPTIQQSNKTALDNGMSVKLLLEQLKQLRDNVTIPVILMGYINPIFQFGMEAFCKACHDIGIDGLIVPDLPLNVYKQEYASFFGKNNLENLFLITPQTSNERIKIIDDLSNSFIYMVSSASTTGVKGVMSENQLQYFERINKLKLKNPRLIGFGISDQSSFQKACQYANGAIIGSAFINAVAKSKNLTSDINAFVKEIGKN